MAEIEPLFDQETIARRVDELGREIAQALPRDFVAVGLYGVAFKFVDVLHFVSFSIAAPVLTVLVRAWPTNMDTFRRTVEKTATFVTVIIGGAAVHFILFAGETLELLYGAEYEPAANTTRLVLAGEALPQLAG